MSVNLMGIFDSHCRSKFTSDIWRRCWTSMPNIMKAGLLHFIKPLAMPSLPMLC